MPTILDGAAISAAIKQDAKKEVEALAARSGSEWISGTYMGPPSIGLAKRQEHRDRRRSARARTDRRLAASGTQVHDERQRDTAPRVVQQRGDQARLVHAHVGEDAGDRQRVCDVGLAGAAHLAVVDHMAEKLGVER